MQLIGALAMLGCGGPSEVRPVAPDALPIERIEVLRPSGAVLYVSEASGRPRAMRGSLGGDASMELSGPPGATFPCPPDPRGTHALLIAVEDGPEGHLESLWTVALDGGAATRIAGPSQTLRSPAWTPDGSAIVFESDISSFRDLYRVGREGGEPRRLTDAKHGSFEPVIAPCGRIAFGTSRDGNAEIYTMDAEGGSVTRITDDPTDDTSPRWSPDGASLAWLRREGLAVHAWVASADGSGARRLRAPRERAIDTDLAWSPDGKRVAVTVQTGPTDLAIDLVDVGSGAVTTIDRPGVDEQPSWGPDGEWLVFASATGRGPALFAARADGSGVVQVSGGEHPEWLPRWLP